jgi:NhaP-type Na+/H+ or K+/H+ antiporter
LIFAALLFFAVRPLSVIAGFVGAGMPWPEQAMSAWFGIRGMASLYYLAYLKTHGVSGTLVNQLADIVLAVIVCSIVLHGVSVTPLMRWFEHLRGERE